MNWSELAVRIDRLLDPVKTLREAMEARIEKAADGPPGLWVWREAGDQEAFRLRLSKVRDAFNDRLGTMKAAMVDLEDAGYAGAPRPAKMRYIYDRNSPDFLQWALDDGHEPGPAEMGLMYEAAANSRDTPAGMVAETVAFLCDLEQALLAARKWLKAQKPPKRPAIALKPEHEAILLALANSHPVTMTQEDLADVANCSVRTVGTLIAYLDKHKLTNHPLGDHSGSGITAAGLETVAPV